MWEIIFVLGIGLLFIGIGLAISKYKCYWLISGYNTSSKEEKENVDVNQLGKHMGRLCYLIAIGIWVTALLVHFFEISISIPTIVITLITFGYIFYMQKFDNNKGCKADKIIIIVIAVFILFIMILMMSVGNTPNQVSKQVGKIVISGNYGVTINDEHVKGIELVETMPKILLRTGGSSDGKRKSGNFKLEDDVVAKLYLQNNKGPYIKIVTEKYEVYINNKDIEKTEEIYNNLISSEL